jgi:DNA-binding NarL/FixJ family response regulator
MKDGTHKALVPFTETKPLVPGKGGGLRHWRLERDKQELRDEIGELAKVLRRLSQELIDVVLFLRDPTHKTPEAIQRQVIRIMGALKRESAMLTSLFEIADLHPALQRIFAEKTESCLDLLEQPDIDLKLLDSPTITVEKHAKPTLLHMLSNREIQILTLLLAGNQRKDVAKKLNINPWTVSTTIQHIKKKARSIVSEEGETTP